MSSTATAVPADEKALVEQAKHGDRAALGILLERYGPRLFRGVLLPRLGDEAHAYDALSATYERVIQRIDQYEWQPCGFFPWLRVIALRIALDMLRSSRRETLFDADDLSREIDRAERAADHSPVVPDILEQMQDLHRARRRLSQALEAIHPRYAQAIELRVLQERSRDDAARLLGVSPATFDVLLHRSLASLKKALRSQTAEESES